MPPELCKAHQENDKAIMVTYGFNPRTITESEIVAELFRLISGTGIKHTKVYRIFSLKHSFTMWLGVL